MRATILAMILAAAGLPAVAQTSEDARYQLISVSGGFVRLDMVSGVMTFCRDEVDSFRCSPIPVDPDDESGKALPKPKPETGRLSGKAEDGAQEEFDRALGMMEKTLRSFMAISREKERECAL